VNNTSTMLTSGWGAQAQKHSSLAMDLLLSHPAPICSDEDGPLVFTWLLRSGLVQGGASMLTGKYPLGVTGNCITWLAMNLTQPQRDDQITFR
jgi:hypothetical protein